MKHEGLTSADSYEELLKSLKPPTLAAGDGNKVEARAHDLLGTQEGHMLTENAGITFASSNSALVDLFQELEKTVLPGRLAELLDVAWAKDPLATLCIIYHSRSIPNGKGERETFYRCCGWLAVKHPQTFLRNLVELVRPSSIKPSARKKAEEARADMGEDDFEDVAEELNSFTARSTGYFKDLLQLLVLAANDELTVEGDFKCVGIKTFADQSIRVVGIGKRKHRVSPFDREERKAKRADRQAEDQKARRDGDDALQALKRLRIDDSLAHGAKAHSDALNQKQADKDETKQRIKKKLANEPLYAALHITVARIFAGQLRADVEAVGEAEKLKASGVEEAVWQKAEHSLSLAAKWAPTPGCAHDRQTFVAKSIALILYDDPDEAQSSRYLANYRRKYLVPLRARLDIVETRLSAKQYDKVNYPRVPAIAMSKLKKIFAAQDAERFTKFMVDVSMGARKISGASLTPSTLVHDAQRGLWDEVGEAQWISLVRSVADEGKLANTMAIVDVSGSMTCPVFSDHTNPIDTSLALGFIIAKVAQAPYENTFISFSEVPTWVTLEPSATLRQCVEHTMRCAVGYSTNFVAAMRLILERAKQAKARPDQMIERLIVLSDMEFDSADGEHSYYSALDDSYNGGASLRTHHEILEKEFKDAGYELPTMVYWNIAGSDRGRTSKAVQSDTPGTALISGYSAAMLKLFLDGGDFPEPEEEDDADMVLVGEEGKTTKVAITPEGTMRKAISHVSFSRLEIFD